MTKSMRDMLRTRNAELARMRDDKSLDKVPQWVLRSRYPLTMGATMERGKDYTGTMEGIER
jgi:hypothetical protein